MSRVKHNPINERKKFWTEYVWDKCSWGLFYQRMVKFDYPREIAIKERLPSNSSKKQIWTAGKKRTNHKMVNDSKYNPSYYSIDIRYPLEEEINIFKRAYLRQIEIAESKVYEAETPEETTKANKELNKIIQEYKTFLSFNPLHHV